MDRVLALACSLSLVAGCASNMRVPAIAGGSVLIAAGAAMLSVTQVQGTDTTYDEENGYNLDLAGPAHDVGGVLAIVGAVLLVAGLHPARDEPAPARAAPPPPPPPPAEADGHPHGPYGDAYGLRSNR